MNLNSLIEHALAQTLLHSLWQLAVLALLAAMLLGVLHRSSAAIKHALGMVFLMAMVFIPALTFYLLVSENNNAAMAAHTTGVLPLLMPAMLNLSPVSTTTSTLLLPWFWCAGVVFMLMRLIGGWWMLRKLDHQQSLALPANWLQRAESIRIALGIRRDVTIRLLENMGMPCTARVWRPIVWLPVSILTQLDADQIEALIAHELAHIRRLDWVWNGLQCVIEAILFYHPAVWWLNRRIRQERENACDDLAVAVCGDAIVLAEALSNLERARFPRHALALSADGGSLMQRITRLISPDTPVRIRWGVPIGLLAILFSGVLIAAKASNTGSEKSLAETASWWTSVGNSTQLHDDSDGNHRVYRKWIDLSGNVHETLSLNGKSMPIDGTARKWLKQQLALANNIPAPPEPPALPDLPPPPAPPEPPEPPDVRDSEAVKAAVSAMQKDAGSKVLLGNAIQVESVDGPTHISNDEATMSLVMSGSKGRASVYIAGEKNAGRWTFSTIDIAPLESSAK